MAMALQVHVSNFGVYRECPIFELTFFTVVSTWTQLSTCTPTFECAL